MLKRHVVFGDGDTDKRLLKSAIAALEDPVLSIRYEYSVEFDDSTGKTTLYFWQRVAGGWNAQ